VSLKGFRAAIARIGLPSWFLRIGRLANRA